MEFSEEYFSNDEEDKFQPTLLETNADSINEIPIKANYKKWIDSESEVSNISSIIKLEKDTSKEKLSLNHENEPKEKVKEESKEKDKEKGEYDNIKSLEIKKEEKIEDKNFIFIWTEGGNRVKLTGSFCDWKISFRYREKACTFIYYK